MGLVDQDGIEVPLVSSFHELLEEIDEQLPGRVPTAGFPLRKEGITVSIRTTGRTIT